MAIDQPTPERSFASLTPVGGTSRPSFSVTSTSAEIGQGPRNDIVVDDDTVSTTHARIEFAEGGWRITDLSSKNGTFVNGTRLEPGVPTPLPDGATVALGAAQLTFSAQGAPEPAARPSAPPRVSLARPSPAATTRFRLPVWLVLLIVILVGIALAYTLGVFDAPAPVQPLPNGSTAMLVLDVRVMST